MRINSAVMAILKSLDEYLNTINTLKRQEDNGAKLLERLSDEQLIREACPRIF